MIKKSEVTLDATRKLTLLVAKTSLSLVKRSMRLGGFTETEQEMIKDNVLDVFTQMGIEKPEQETTLVEWHRFTEIDYVRLILGERFPQDWSEEDKKQYDQIRKKLASVRPSPESLRDLFEKNAVLTPFRAETITDYEYYLEHKVHRRPDFWVNQKDHKAEFNL
jgi:hypothetical protein